MGRNTDLLGRVRHNLNIHGIKIITVEDADIYDALSKIQDRIIAEKKCLDKTVLLPLVISTTDYALTGLKDEDDNVISIATIKGIIRPDTWEYPVEVVASRDWDTILNDKRNSYYPSYYVSSNQPLWCTFYERMVKFYPAPVAVETVKLICTLANSYSNINSSTVPILPQYLDPALEYGATAELLPPKFAMPYEQKLESQLRKVGSLGMRASTYARQNKQWE